MTKEDTEILDQVIDITTAYMTGYKRAKIVDQPLSVEDIEQAYFLTNMPQSSCHVFIQGVRYAEREHGIGNVQA